MSNPPIEYGYQEQCTTMHDSEFIGWIHDRLMVLHGESPNLDYMHRLLEISEELQRIGC